MKKQKEQPPCQIEKCYLSKLSPEELVRRLILHHLQTPQQPASDVTGAAASHPAPGDTHAQTP